MAIGTKVIQVSQIQPEAKVPNPEPTGLVTNWADIHTSPETADNSGTKVTNPLALTAATLFRTYAGALGGSALLRLKYDDDASGSVTNPVIHVFGFDANGLPQRLRDAGGNEDFTLTIDVNEDVTDGTYKYTDEIEVELKGNLTIMATVKTAMNFTGTKNNSAIQARVAE